MTSSHHHQLPVFFLQTYFRITCITGTPNFRALCKKIYSERQKYGINSLKIKQNFFQKNLWTGQF
jgi:hypothetical protein